RAAVMARDALLAHRVDLDAAMIGTVHALCRQLLREYPFEAALDPGAVVLSDDEAEFELLAACGDALEAAAETDDGRTQALWEIGIYALTRELPELVTRRDEVRTAFAAVPDGDAIRAQLDAARHAAA